MATIVRNTDPVVPSLVAASNSVRKSAIGAAGASHFDASEQLVAAADATDLPTALTLLNDLVRVFEGLVPQAGVYVQSSSVGSNSPGHLADVLAHSLADATNVTGLLGAAVPTTLAAAETAANTLFTKFNAHRVLAGKHPNNDTTNVATAASATDLASLAARLNDIKVQLVAHIASALAGASLRQAAF